MEGQIVAEDKVLVIRSIHVTYHLAIGSEHHEAVERVHSKHADYCPVARTLKGCVDITTSLDLVEA